MGTQLGVSTGAERPERKWQAILEMVLESCACMDPFVCAYYITDKRQVELRNAGRNRVRAAASPRPGLRAVTTPPIAVAPRAR